MSFLKLISGGSGSKGHHRSSSSRSIARRDLQNSQLSNDLYKLPTEITQGHEGKIKQAIDEEHFASGMPTDQPALFDKIDSHRGGTLFKYAVITNKPSDERQSMLSKIRSFKPQSKVTNLTLDSIPPIRLLGDSVNLDLRQIVSSEILSNGEDYLMIDCILVHFIPLDSFANDKSVVNVQVNDFRKTTNTAVRIAKVDNTMGYNILFFLDYCIEKKDVSRMSLSFSCATKEFQEGVAWGAVKVVAQLQTRSFPVRMPLIGTMGVLLLSDTDLEEFECDPRTIDLVITPESLKRLRQLSQRGDIQNRTIAVNDSKDMITAKTVLGEGYESKEVSSVIGDLKELAILKERQQAAKLQNRLKLNEISGFTRVHEDGTREPITDNPPINVLNTEEIRENSHNPPDISPEDSASMRGDSQSEIIESIANDNSGKVRFMVD